VADENYEWDKRRVEDRPVHVRAFQYLVALLDTYHAVLVCLQRCTGCLNAVWREGAGGVWGRRDCAVDEGEDREAADAVGGEVVVLEFAEGGLMFGCEFLLLVSCRAGMDGWKGVRNKEP